MKASVIIAHPYAESFNHAVYNTVCAKLEKMHVEFYKHDLYEEEFNPVLTTRELGKEETNDPLVRQYADELLQSEYLFFIHPNWWGQPPAILKGYIDRIIRPPYAYDFHPDDSGGGLPIGKLKGKYGIVFNTSNTEKTREEDYFGDPLERIWKECVFGFCGIEKYYRRMFRIIADSDLQQRQKWLLEVEQVVEDVIEKSKS